MIVPIICVAMVFCVVLARLNGINGSLEEGKARVASAWLSDRVAVVGDEERPKLLERAAGKMGLLTGLFGTHGDALAPTPLEKVPSDTLRRALAGEILEATLSGEVYRLASTSLRPPLSRMNVVVAVRKEGLAAIRPEPLIRLAVAALVLMLAAVVFGMCFGLDYRTELGEIVSRLNAVVMDPDGADHSPAIQPSVSELVELSHAVGRLKEKLDSEMGQYLSARKEVDSLEGKRDNLLSAVTVELYRPLNELVTLSERLLAGEDGELKGAQKEDVQIILKAAARLREMVNEILDLSSLLEDDLNLDFERVDMTELATDVIEVARGGIGKKSLSLEMDAKSDERAFVRGNRQRLWQAITNLVSNAVKFTESGGVNVSVSRREDGSVILIVEDTGVGIASLDQATVFDTFRQLGGRTGRKRGTGLGLAICKRLIELHGGKVRVSSVIGKGTKFTVILPGAE